MAYLDSTTLNDFQATEATNEKRVSKYGMLDLAKDSTPSVDYIPPSVKEKMMMMSASRDAQIPVLKDQEVVVVTTPGFNNIPSNLAETDSYAFTAVDVFTGFRMYPASFENNQVDMDWYRNNVLRNVLQGAAVEIDNIVETQLEARKTQVLDFTTQVSQGTGSFTFNTTPDVLEISKEAVKDTLYANLQSLMSANKLDGDYRMVTSPAGLTVQQTEAFSQGPNNDRNVLWNEQAFPIDRRYESHQLAPGSDIFNGFHVRDGAIGLVENFPWDFRNGTEFAGKKWAVSDVELPFTRMRANVYMNTEATEATSLVSPGTDTNLTMTHFEEMALWFRFYVVYRYNSDLATRANDIVKISGKVGA
jgi:hypothetical protein